MAGSPVGVSGDISTRDMCKGKPDPNPARAEKRTASRFYQLKSGCVPEEHGQQTARPLLVVRPGERLWESSDEGHLFKHCDRWKDQQAEMWARVKEATKRGKQTYG